MKVQNRKLAVNVSEAAEMLSVSRPTMYQILDRDDFNGAFRIGSRRRVSVAALQDWIDKQVREAR